MPGAGAPDWAPQRKTSGRIKVGEICNGLIAYWLLNRGGGGLKIFERLLQHLKRLFGIGFRKMCDLIGHELSFFLAMPPMAMK